MKNLFICFNGTDWTGRTMPYFLSYYGGSEITQIPDQREESQLAWDKTAHEPDNLLHEEEEECYSSHIR